MSIDSEKREEIVRQLRRLGVSETEIPEIADAAEDLVAAGEHPGDAVEEVFRRRAIKEKRGRDYLL